MDRFSVAVNGMLLFANERQVLNGNPGVVVAVELLKPGVSKIVSGEFARTHRADNWQHPLSKEQIQRVAECILGAKVSAPMQTIDRYELLDQLCSFEPLEFRARCTLPGAPKEEEFRLRRHNLGLLAQDNERERVWRLVWREYQALRKLAKQHVRGIPLPHDPFFDPDDDTVAWTVSEHIPGRPLYERVSDRPLPIGPVLAQLAAALSQAHAGGLIHRHFTPDALWIASSDDSAWILHWDLARMIEQQTISSQIRDRLRKDSRYLAPEVRDRPDRVSPASDLYSFAVVALELLQGAVLMTDHPEEAQAVASKLPRSNLPIAQCQKLLSAAVSPEASERGGLAALGASLADVTLTSSLHS
jgi:serine/threonine protein kinase